jgi:hypothetical protein
MDVLASEAMQRKMKRAVIGDTIYWLKPNGSPDLWIVTADGTPISYPTDYDTALVAFRAVTAL